MKEQGEKLGKAEADLKAKDAKIKELECVCLCVVWWISSVWMGG